MDDSLHVPDDYKEAFNKGYMLSKTMPEIFDHIQIPQEDMSEKIEAFNAGRKQFHSERSKEREMNKDNQPVKDRNHDIRER